MSAVHVLNGVSLGHVLYLLITGYRLGFTLPLWVYSYFFFFSAKKWGEGERVRERDR